MSDEKERLNAEGQPANPSDQHEELQEQLHEQLPELREADPVLELPEIPVVSAESEVASVLEMEAPQPAPKNRSGWKMFAAALALVAMGAGVGSATTWALARSLMPAATPIGYINQSAGVKAVSQTVPEGGASVIPSIYRRVSPSIVKISVSTQRGFSSGAGTGSGFVVDPRGYILTNYHVIDGASRIEVKFVDGTIMEAQLIGSDRYMDLAVIKVDPGNRSLVAAPLGNSDEVEVGELAIAIGSPFGQEFTVTAGIVSALNRTVQEENNPFSIPGAIQTDAAINPGNSGGPLLNATGEVIGINTLIETGSSGVRGNIGIGFAVPVNAAKQILPTLMAGERVQYPWMGVGLGTMTPQLAQQIGTDVTEGAVVSMVYPDSPAEKAGLKSAGFNRRDELVSADVVTDIDGKAIKTADDLVEYVRSKKVGDVIKMTVVRGKERLTIDVTLAARPEQLENN